MSGSLTVEFSEQVESIINTAVEEKVGMVAREIVGEKVEGDIKEAIKEAAKELRPTYVKIPGKKGKGKKMEGTTHKNFQDALHIAHAEGQLFLKGPAGSGKTTLARNIADARSLDFASLSCSFGMSEAHLLGRMLFDGEYVESDFVRLYENGGVFLFDEIDAADANTLLVINSALANGYMSVPNRKEKQRAERHENFICIVAGNTWGKGSVEYAGRNRLDSAFMDRFTVAKLEIDYDTDLEGKIAGDHAYVAGFFQGLRGEMKKKEVLKLASTRAIVSTVRHIEMGKSLDWSLDVFFSDWTQDEMAKVRDWGNKRLKEIKTALQPPKPKKVEEGDPEPAEEMDVENHDKDLPF